MKKTETSYEEYVKKGKGLLNKISCHQAQIAYYAVKVCEIKHGGKTRSSVYTMAKYAADIGMKGKTLSEWVAVYKNVISKIDINPGKVTQKDWVVARRVNNLFAQEKRTMQALLGLKGKQAKGISSKDISPAKVKDLFNQNYDGPSFQNEVYAWNDYVMYVRNKLVARDLSTVSLSSLVSLKENLDKASDHILRQITKANKPKISAMNVIPLPAMPL